MKCPHCTDVTLVMSERQGVEIDYCPNAAACGWTAVNWTSSSRATRLPCRRPAPQAAYQQPGRRPDFRGF
jgi:Zn-finger nucleic acid-binding protein